MTAFVDTCCRTCNRRYGWCGDPDHPPPCPHCAKRPPATADRRGLSPAHRQRCEELFELESGLADREIEFIEDIYRRNWPLTDKQARWLDAICERLLA